MLVCVAKLINLSWLALLATNLKLTSVADDSEVGSLNSYSTDILTGVVWLCWGYNHLWAVNFQPVFFVLIKVELTFLYTVGFQTERKPENW